MAFERIEADIGYNVMIVFSQRTADAAPIVDWHGSPSDQAGRADVVPIVVGHGMVWLESEGFLECLDGLVQPPLLEQGGAEVGVGVGGALT